MFPLHRRTEDQSPWGSPCHVPTHLAEGEVEAQRQGETPPGTQHGRPSWEPLPLTPCVVLLMPTGQLAVGVSEGGVAVGRWQGEAQPSLQTPHSQHSLLIPRPLASHPDGSASPQEGQEDGPAGWRANLKPVDRRSPAERLGMLAQGLVHHRCLINAVSM